MDYLQYDFSDFNSICDVGGGQGAFLIQLLANYPYIKGFVADLPGAAISAEKAIAKADLNDRCKAIPYDFLKEAPPVCIDLTYTELTELEGKLNFE